MKSFHKWIRIIHRDLGFIMVGLCLVYGISGFTLNHMGDNNPAYKTTDGIVQLCPKLNDEGIKKEWNSKKKLPAISKVAQIDENHFRLLFKGGIGIYSFCDGKVEYEIHQKRVLIYWCNKLHYNSLKGWTIMGDIFAFSLVFFAISGVVMVKGKRGIKGRGKWFVLIGIIIPVLYITLA